MQGAADELAATSVRCVQAIGAAIGSLRLPMLGLRCVRAEYLQRVDAWASAMTVSLSESTVPAGPLLPRPPAAPDRAHTWLRTPEGRSLRMELRCLALDRHTGVNRLRLQMSCRRACATRCMLPPLSRGAASRYGRTATMPLVRKVKWSFRHGMLGHRPLPRRFPVEPKRTCSILAACRPRKPYNFAPTVTGCG